MVGLGRADHLVVTYLSTLTSHEAAEVAVRRQGLATIMKQLQLKAPVLPGRSDPGSDEAVSSSSSLSLGAFLKSGEMNESLLE